MSSFERFTTNHQQGREARRRVGVGLLVVGVPLLVLGVFLFARPFFTSSAEFFANSREVMDRDSRSSILGLIFLVLGSGLSSLGARLAFSGQGGILSQLFTSARVPETQRPPTLPAAKIPYPRDAKEARCDQCGTKNDAHARFCDTCGERLTRTCRECGQRNTRRTTFCEQCGERLA